MIIRLIAYELIMAMWHLKRKNCGRGIGKGNRDVKDMPAKILMHDLFSMSRIHVGNNISASSPTWSLNCASTQGRK